MGLRHAVGWAGLLSQLAAVSSVAAAGPPAKLHSLAPCDRLAAYARTLTHANWTKGDDALASALKFAKEANVQPSDSGASGSNAAIAHSPVVQKAFDEAYPSTIQVERAPRTDLVRMAVDGGTLHCQSFVFARATGRKPVRLVDAPASANDEICWSTDGDLATLYGQVAFVVHDSTSGIEPYDNIIVTPWNGERWGAACETDLQFDTAVRLTERYCDDKDVCVQAARVAPAVVGAYNRFRRQGGDADKFTYGARPPTSVQISIELSRGQAGASPMTEFPTFGVKAEDHPLSYSGFAYFPLKIGQTWYAAAISREGVGWREDDNTLLIVYDLKFGTSKPLASFVVPVSVTRLVSAKVVSPRPHDER